MSIKNLKPMAAYEILRQYNDGKRDFRKIRCVNADFISKNLSNADFSGSDLGFSGFRICNLTNTNLSYCNLVWSNFSNSVMRNTNLSHSRLNWSALNDVIFENTNMEEADLSYCILFRTNRGACNLKGANETMVAWDISEISTAGLSEVKENLQKLKNMIPYDLWLQIKYKIDGTQNESKKNKQSENEISKYLNEIGTGSYTEKQNKQVLQNMGLGAYGIGGSVSYSGIEREKKDELGRKKVKAGQSYQM